MSTLSLQQVSMVVRLWQPHGALEDWLSGLHNPAATHVYDYQPNLLPREHSAVMRMLSCKNNQCSALKIVTLRRVTLERMTVPAYTPST
jgi:hypothetical protein